MVQVSLHVVRKGTPYGQFSPAEIHALLEQGKLESTDEVYSEGDRRWLPLSQWVLANPHASAHAGTMATPGENLPAAAAPLASPEGDAPEDPPEDQVEEDSDKGFDERSEGSKHRRRKKKKRGPSREDKRKLNKFFAVLPGWIAALFLLVIAVAVWLWGASRETGIHVAQQRIDSLTEQIEVLKSANARFLEFSPPDEFRGVVLVSSPGGRLSLVSGAKVFLYRREDLVPLLSEMQALPVPVNEIEFSAVISRFQQMLPSPIAVSLTDADGRFTLQAPDSAGQYVVLASTTEIDGNRSRRLLWILPFSPDGLPLPVQPLSEGNAISLAKPEFEIAVPRK